MCLLRTDEGWPAEVFKEMCTGRTVQAKGPRMALCRWMSWFDSVKYWWRCHSMRLCLFMMWGIRMGRLDGSQESTQLTLRGFNRAAQPTSQSETLRVSKARARSLYDAAKNQMHVAMIVALDPALKRSQRICYTICHPVRHW